MKGFLLDLAKWAAVSIVILATGMLAMSVCGCSSPTVSEPTYPKYDKWWTEALGPRRSTNLSDLGQGDILVFDNGLEAVLL